MAEFNINKVIYRKISAGNMRPDGTTPMISKKQAKTIGPIRWLVALIMSMIMLGSLSIYFYLPQAMKESAIETAKQSNIETIDQIKLMRSYYTQIIVARALKSESLHPSMDYKTNENRIPLPATLVKDLSDLMSKQHTKVSLVSPYPWPHRANRILDDFESAAWKKFQTDPDAIESRLDFVDGKRVMRVAVADRMVSQTCVNCHNTDLLSSKKDWKVGDVRAVFEVTKFVEPYLAAAEEKGRYISTGIAMAAAIACAVLLLCLAIVEKRNQEIRKADDQAYYLAEHDVLTGLSNRARLNSALETAFKNPNLTPDFTLFLIDLDRFKAVNDTYGHDAGDKLLKIVSQRLRGVAGSGDLIARLGGDEFAIVSYRKASDPDLMQIGQSICRAMTDTVMINGQAISIGATVGISRGRVDGNSAADMLVAADLALYSAKSTGRGRCELFKSDFNIALLNRRKLESDLRDALERNEFELYLQPVVSLISKRAERFEALLRWNHPERGCVGPAEFIPTAEEIGLIVPIGEWVIHAACYELSLRQPSFRIAINLSARQLQHDGLMEVLSLALKRYNIDPSRLEVEITESSMMHEDKNTIVILQKIRSLGISIAIDDFGTGYSCLSYLQNYPVTCVKIDRSFVSQLTNGQKSQSIIRAIVALAKALDLEIVAEGVETREQLEIVARLGCVFVQGFLIEKPRPVSTFPTLQNRPNDRQRAA